MILILSINTDGATTNVQFWLRHFNQYFIRINDSDVATLKWIHISENATSVKIEVKSPSNTTEFDLRQIKGYWYRRGFINISSYRADIKAVDRFIKEEDDDIQEFIHSELNKIAKVNKIDDLSLNKLIAIRNAQDCGLRVPVTAILSERSALIDFYLANNKKILTKPIYNCFEFIINSKRYFSGVSIFPVENLLHEIPAKFNPTLFQEYIEKKIEIRAFFLNGRFYASGIFSQLDEKTKIDFRNYNNDHPNRVNPIVLPSAIQTKLLKFMSRMNLMSGSIDLVYTPEGEFVFLEVNPIGQYAQVSEPCNYFLDREIAIFLKNKIEH